MRLRFSTPIFTPKRLSFRAFNLGSWVLMGALGLTGLIGLTALHWVDPPIAIGQIIRTENAWRQVYEQIPDLPRENQYVSKESGKVLPDDTLVGRLIRYHVYVKGRPPFFRLDWKLTLADYLGVNGAMDEADYPSAAKVRKNPMDGDLEAIRKLNRAQRDALVQALVTSFSSEKNRRSPRPTPKPIIDLPRK